MRSYEPHQLSGRSRFIIGTAGIMLLCSVVIGGIRQWVILTSDIPNEAAYLALIESLDQTPGEVWLSIGGSYNSQGNPVTMFEIKDGELNCVINGKRTKFTKPDAGDARVCLTGIEDHTKELQADVDDFNTRLGFRIQVPVVQGGNTYLVMISAERGHAYDDILAFFTIDDESNWTRSFTRLDINHAEEMLSFGIDYGMGYDNEDSVTVNSNGEFFFGSTWKGSKFTVMAYINLLNELSQNPAYQALMEAATLASQTLHFEGEEGFGFQAADMLKKTILELGELYPDTISTPEAGY